MRMVVAILRENDVDRHEIAIGFDGMEGKVNFDRNASPALMMAQSARRKGRGTESGLSCAGL